MVSDDDATTGQFEWSAFYDEEGRLFYYNSVTQESAWIAPSEGFNPPEKAEEAPADTKVVEGKADYTKDSSSSSGNTDDEPGEESSDAKKEAMKVYDWTAHYDEEGRLYYYNSVTDESAWEPPEEGFNPSAEDLPEAVAGESAEVEAGESEEVEAEAEDVEGPETSRAVEAASGSREHLDETATGEAEKDAGGSSIVKTYDWSAHYDEEGRLYFYNSATKESAWEPPVEGFNPTAEPPAAAIQIVDAASVEIAGSVETSWVAYKDEEGREYYYNLESDETQWEKPEHYKKAPADDEEDQAADSDYDGGSVTNSPSAPREDEKSDTDDGDMEEPSSNQESSLEKEPEEEQIDPAVKRLQDAEAALNSPDSVLEPSCMTNVSEVVAANGGNPAKAISALIENYHGQSAVCGLLARWLMDLNQKKQGVASKDAAKRLPNLANTDVSNADRIREVAQNVINKIAKERFTKEEGDAILDLSKSEAAFLEEMMDSSRWRKLLIDLSAAHKDSAVLLYCLRAISKRGHHREIARRINQSDHFAVFNAMLLSELSVIGSQAVAAGSDVAAATGLEELVQDLTRACSATSYTYLYSVEMLRQLESMARAETAAASVSNDGVDVQDSQERFRRAVRKWEALSQILESSMVDPSLSQTIAGSSPLLRKRRLDVALTISELHQRQRRRRRLTNNGDYHNGEDTGHSDTLETALLTLLKRHSIGIQVEDAVLDKLLPSGLDMDTRGVGELLIQHPLAVRALLGHLYKPGPTRVTSPSTKNKCARLVALAVIAAEDSAKEEANARGTRVDNNNADEEAPDELALTRMIVQGSQLCEQVETLISFLVTTDTEKPGQSNTSLGQKLCSLALKCAPVGLGVAIWAREFTHGKEYAVSASFPTLSPSILSLVRLVALKHPFSRSDVLQVALAFLRHSNSEISYQKVNSIKESSLRLLIFLLMKGDVVPVLNSLSVRLRQAGSSELDASLVRYFVGGVLEVVQPPVSPVFVRMFGGLLNAPKVVDAVRSSYFSEANRKRLVMLLSAFKDVRSHDGSPLDKEAGSLVSALLATYQVEA